MDAYGTGKTLCLCKEAIIRAFDGPENFILLARAKLKDAKATTLDVFKSQALPKELDRRVKWNKGDGAFTFPNGSIVKFIGFDDPEDYESYELGMIGIDQAENPACEWGFRQLRFRVRRVVAPDHIQRRRRIVIGNPKGKGNWVHRMWARHASDPDWDMIGGYGTTSNQYLPDDYVESLLDMEGDEALRLVAGEWAGSEGPILENWNSEVHVIPQFRVPDEWLKVRGVDTGLTHRTACAWAAVDEEQGNIYIYQEHMGEHVELGANCRNILDITMDDEIAYTSVDPAALTKDPINQLSIFDQMVSHGISPLTLANNDVGGSITRLRELLHYKVDKFGRITQPPHLYVMDNCPETASQLEEWSWELKQGKPTGKPAKQNDDFVDCVRYIVMGLGYVGDREMQTQPTQSEHDKLVMWAVEQAERRERGETRLYRHQSGWNVNPAEEQWRGGAWL